jgi:glutathione S-transferase
MEKNSLVQAVFLVLLPIGVAWFELSTGSAVALVLLVLLWRWAMTLRGISAPKKGPELILQTISASHFVEKVRWSMDRLGVNYTEQPAAGTLGAFFGGRTVPVLRFRTGMVYSSIGNSAEILRYLWGRYAAENEQAALFLQPTGERLALEKQFDRYGVNLQVWVYHHILHKRQLTLHAWGCDNPAIPLYQRLLLRPLFPLLRFLIRKSFRITTENYRKAVERIESCLSGVESRLADGRCSLLGGCEINFSDISFAAISGLWLQPDEFGGGQAGSVKMSTQEILPAMQADITRWSEKFPATTEFIARLYREQRRMPVQACPG